MISVMGFMSCIYTRIPSAYTYTSSQSLDGSIPTCPISQLVLLTDLEVSSVNIASLEEFGSIEGSGAHVAGAVIGGKKRLAGQDACLARDFIVTG